MTSNAFENVVSEMVPISSRHQSAESNVAYYCSFIHIGKQWHGHQLRWIRFGETFKLNIMFGIQPETSEVMCDTRSRTTLCIPYGNCCLELFRAALFILSKCFVTLTLVIGKFSHLKFWTHRIQFLPLHCFIHVVHLLKKFLIWWYPRYL